MLLCASQVACLYAMGEFVCLFFDEEYLYLALFCFDTFFWYCLMMINISDPIK